MPIFPTLCKFSVCASVTLCHKIPSFTLQIVRTTVTHLSNVSVIGGNVLKIVWFIISQFGYPHCVGIMYMSMYGLSLVPIV